MSNDDHSSTGLPETMRRTPRRTPSLGLSLIIPGVVLAVLVLLMVVLTFRWLPDDGEGAAVWSTEGGQTPKGPEPPGYEKVIDDTRIVRRPYFRLLRLARKKTEEELYESALADFPFEDLANNPQKYRGALLRVKGRVLDVRPLIPEPDPSEQESLPAQGLDVPGVVYQTEIVTLVNGGVTAKYFLHTEEFPRRLSPGDEVAFAGYFYNRYKGKQVELKEGGRAVVVAPLLLGRSVRHIGGKGYSPEPVRVDLHREFKDRTKISEEDKEAVLAAVEAMKSVQGASDLSYFDMAVNPVGEAGNFSGCVVRISGEVSRIESLRNENVPEALKKYRRITLTINKDTPFTRYAAVYVSPDVGEIQQMQVVTLRGIFIKSVRMDGGLYREMDLPLVAGADAESIAWPETGGMDGGLRTLLVGVVIIAATAMCAAGVIFYMTHRDRRKRLERTRALRDIMDKDKGQG